MADAQRIPKMRIEGASAQEAPSDGGTPSPTVSERPAPEPTLGAQAAAGKADEGGSRRGPDERAEKPQGGRAVTGVDALMRRLAGHEHAAIGAICGLLVALLVFAIGLLRTLLIVLLVGVGVAIGQFLDGDPKMVDTIRRVIAAWRK